MLEQLFSTTQGYAVVALNPAIILFNLLLAFVLSLIIALVYKATHRGLSYSQTFVTTLIISGIVIAAVMMVIGNDIARAFGAFGAFSLIRFRTAIKDAKDMGYIFLVLAVGMAAGTNNYLIALATTAVVLIILFALYKLNFGSIRKFDYLLNFSLDTSRQAENIYKPVFDQYLKSSSLLNIKAIESGQVLQLSFSIKFISESDAQSFITELERLNGIANVNLITAKNDVEY
ncbi:MAG: hypothetical protein A3J59_02375 [Candidatus Buchananbacteria bacterium RIFCSPHIGHO2_02_FULL_56_16]|uniref:DUF4956 domain-containing protein n=1 Tax=Candidatus Buchananbacteria bacterium RIFCSPHIGHO2_02_FULL_56_16 TaxID=1797542 RepID=A0A1G1YG13_9BACT|nr:MAG: hypothetical protein A3J59_02375 [Candidatus Buchananbacteria bacterium RIFCSPHIGHO2_02_FULL_56_16]